MHFSFKMLHLVAPILLLFLKVTDHSLPIFLVVFLSNCWESERSRILASNFLATDGASVLLGRRRGEQWCTPY